MPRAAHFLAIAALLSLFTGCKKQASDGDAIRDGINQHLAGVKTINLSAMDMDVTSYSVQGNQAQAQVEFRPKGGGPAGMQVSYTLEKQNGAWVVQNAQPMGMGGSGANPNMMPSAPSSSGSSSSGPSSSGPSSSGSMPNFRELVPGGGGGNGGALPPGHPPINGQAPANPK
jgi:hypothetical protein